jgi:hypothetical protein
MNSTVPAAGCTGLGESMHTLLALLEDSASVCFGDTLAAEYLLLAALGSVSCY